MRRSFIGEIQRVGSKSATSAAPCARQLLVSNAVTGAMGRAEVEAMARETPDLTEAERAYLQSQPLARLATVDGGGDSPLSVFFA